MENGMVWAPRVTVAAVIEQAGRHLLVEERAGGRAVLNQPAGHLEPGESLPAAVVREVREETGWRFHPEALVGVYRWEGAGDTWLRFCFTGPAEAPAAPPELDPDIVAVHWLSPGALAGRPLRSPLVARAIADYRAGRRYPLDLLVDHPDIAGAGDLL